MFHIFKFSPVNVIVSPHPVLLHVLGVGGAGPGGAPLGLAHWHGIIAMFYLGPVSDS